MECIALEWYLSVSLQLQVCGRLVVSFGLSSLELVLK